MCPSVQVLAWVIALSPLDRSSYHLSPRRAGKQAPAACSSFPQSTADIPEKPYENYTSSDFTEFIAAQKKEQEMQAQQSQQSLQEQKDADSMEMYKKMGLLAVLFIVTGIIVWWFACGMKGSKTEAEAEKLLPDTSNKNGEHV